MRVLIVDGANVVGSRPDGWWRDRAGAARGLYERLSAAELPFDQVVLVLEGAAKAGVDESAGPTVVVHAPRDGDETIVEQVRIRAADTDDVTVVSADRALAARVAAAGGDVVGPRWLLART